MSDLVSRRLHAQGLVETLLPSPMDVVRRLAAVQAQDYPAAKWALAQRTGDATEADIDRLFDEGAILRTHVMRPTWHFVLPDDIRWLLALTGPRVRAGIGPRLRQLELDDHVVDQAEAVFTAALSGGRCLTRSQLGEELLVAGIVPEGQRLPHLLMVAELDGLIVSGPRRGKQHTYALLEERAPDARLLDRDEAIAELATRYFRSHGPATAQDFAWWSGLKVADARRGIALAARELEQETLDGVNYWSDAASATVGEARAVAHLLPNFDEYTVGYRDRDAVLQPEIPFDANLFSFGSVLANVLTLGGRVRGSWRRVVTGGRVTVELRLLAPLTGEEADAVSLAVDRMAGYFGRPVALSIVQTA